MADYTDHDTNCPDCNTRLTRHEGPIVTFTCPDCGETFSAPDIELIEAQTGPP